MKIEIIEKYFPDLTAIQRERFGQLLPVYEDWNSRINVISRKDMDNFYQRHILHSLAIAKVCIFNKGARVLDVGCGGGFPGIPLAILFPDVKFTLIDSIAKKIVVVREVVAALQLDNVEVINGRAEGLTGKYDYVVSRAVTSMQQFVGWVWNRMERGSGAGSLPSGILYLKGGDLSGELAETGKCSVVYSVCDFFDEEFFATKSVVYIKK